MTTVTAAAPIDHSSSPILDYLRLYVKDDDDLLEHVLITSFSSFTAEPLNLGILSPSSTGKTYVATLVTDLFPNAEELTGASAKSFFYESGVLVAEQATERREADGTVSMVHEDLQGRLDELDRLICANPEEASHKAERRDLLARSMRKINLERRILVFLEPPNYDLFEALKPLLSHDKWESLYKTVDRGPTGQQSTRKILLVGWPTFIFCSAKNLDTWAMWPEIQSRCVIASPRMDSDKYREANELSAKLLGLPSFALKQIFPKELELAAREEVRGIEQQMDLQRILGGSEGMGSRRDNFVFNPLAEQLARLFPHEDGVTMRQFRYLLRYVNLLAMTNSARRPKVVVRDQARAVIATYPDVRRAIDLVYTSSWSSLPRFKLDFYERVLVEAYKAAATTSTTVVLGQKKTEQVFHPLNTEQILRAAQLAGWKMGKRTLRETFLEPLEEARMAASETDPSDKRAYVWRPVQIAQNYGKLRRSHIFDPQTVKQSLKSLRDGIGDLVANFALPDGRLVTDYEDLVNVILPAEAFREEGEQASSSEVVEFGYPESKGPSPDGPSADKAGPEFLIPKPEDFAPPPPGTPATKFPLSDDTPCAECARPARPDHVGPYYSNKSGDAVCRSCFFKHATPRKGRNLNEEGS